MKFILPLCLMFWLAMTGCNNAGEGAIKQFIPGTYTRFADGEYSKAWDTIIINPFDEERKTYLVVKRVGFQKIRGGRLQPKEHDSGRSVVVYHPTTFQLQDPVSGKLYTFSPGSRTVLVGSVLYDKSE